MKVETVLDQQNRSFAIGRFTEVEHFDKEPSLIGPSSETMETTKSETRKSNKPIMEKRRRARINNCLNELKGILLEAMRKDPARHSKLEKADILELTVRHLQNVQRNKLAIAMATDPTVLHRFKNGFSECATEVSRYLNRLEIADSGLKTRVSTHLNGCVNGLQQVNPGFGPQVPRYQPTQKVSFISSPISPPHNPIQIIPQQPIGTAHSLGDVNNNSSSRYPPSLQSPIAVHHHHRIGSIPTYNATTTSPILSTSSSDTQNVSLSSGSDSSFISFSSDKTTNSSPIDFSIKNIVTSTPVRVVKIEPIRTTLSLDKGSMWRPW